MSYTAGNLTLNIIASAEEAEKSLDSLIDKIDAVSDIIGKLASSTGQFSLAMQSLNPENLKWFSSLATRLKRLEGLDLSGLSTHLSSLASAVYPLSQAVSGLTPDNLRWISSLGTRLKKMEDLDSKKISANLEAFAKGLDPLLKSLSKFATSARGAEALLNSLDKVLAKSSKVSRAMQNVSGDSRYSIFGWSSPKFNEGMKTAWTLGKIYLFYNYAKRISNELGKMVQRAIDYQEIMNLWQVAMRQNLGEAKKFINEMNRAYSISINALMHYQATFKNMLSALGALSEETSYKISEGLMQMALDFSSLFNVTAEKAMTTFQAVLSGQVRPIRSIAGLDITENTIYALYQALGGTKTTRQLTQTEKRLLRILAVFQQMEDVALGDFAKTIETVTKQLRIMREIGKDLLMWAGQLVRTWLQYSGILTNINASLIVGREIMKSLAFYAGYIEEDFISGMFSNVIDEADGASEAVDALMGRLFSFDKFESLSKGDGAGILDIDAKLLEELKKYSSVLTSVDNKAQKLAEEWLKTLGFQFDAENNLWNLEEGFEGILGDVGNIASGIGIIAGTMLAVKNPLLATVILFGALYVLSSKFREVINSVFSNVDWIGFGQGMLGTFENLIYVLSEIAKYVDLVFDWGMKFFFKDDGEGSSEEGLLKNIKGETLAKLALGVIGGLLFKNLNAGIITLGVTLAIDVLKYTFKLINAEPLTDDEWEEFATSLGGLIGVAVGYLTAGPLGALLGFTIGSSLGLSILKLAFNAGGYNLMTLGDWKKLATELTTLAGAVIGFSVGGPLGALTGTILGVALSLALSDLFFEENGKVKFNWKHFADILTIVAPSLLGFAVAGPGGGLIGLVLGVILKLVIDGIQWASGKMPEWEELLAEKRGDKELKWTDVTSYGSREVNWLDLETILSPPKIETPPIPPVETHPYTPTQMSPGFAYEAIQNAYSQQTQFTIQGDVYIDGQKAGKILEPHTYAEGVRVGRFEK